MKYIYRILWVFFLPLFIVSAALGFIVWAIVFLPYQALYFIKNGEIYRMDPVDVYFTPVNKIYERLLPK